MTWRFLDIIIGVKLELELESMVVTGCIVVHPQWLWWKDTFLNTHADTQVDIWASLGMLSTTVHTDMVLFPFWWGRKSMYSHWLCSPLLLSVSSLDCSDLGLKAEEGSVCPVTEELEVLKKLIGGLQDIKLIGEVRGEGGGRRTEPWCFNSQHLWRRRRANTRIRKLNHSGGGARWESNRQTQLLTWRCSRVMRDFISLIISTSLGTAGWWCFFDTLLSHSKWCSYSFRSEWSCESVGFSWKQHKNTSET